MSSDTAVALIVIAAAIPANLFPILYTLWTNWWRTAEGRFFFFFVASLAALIDLALIRRAIGMFPGYDFLAIVIYLVLCGGLYHHLYLLIKLNRPRKEQS